jgi:hypothetical protein
MVVAALAIAVGVAAPAASAEQPAAANLAGSVQLIGGWCCGDVWGISGSGAVRGVGEVTFQSEYTVGIDPFLTLVKGVGYVPPFGEVHGDALVVAGSVEWSQADPAPQLTWSVVSGTGRFAGVTGSGTYQVSLNGAAATVTLAGALSK